MLTIITVLLIFFIALLILVKYLENNSVFFPGKSINETPASVGLDHEDLYLTTKDGIKINAWLIKTHAHAPIVIFAHGNAGTIGNRISKIKFFHDLGLNILAFDYRGYGLSEGVPSESGIYLDAQAVFDYVQTRSDVDFRRTIAYGASLGGVVMIDLAVSRKVACLIVESSISSAKEMAHRMYPYLPKFLMSLKFDSLSKIHQVSVPKIFLHSHQDEVVPFSMGHKLYQKALDPKEFIVTLGSHNEGALMSDPIVKEQLVRFLKAHSLI